MTPCRLRSRCEQNLSPDLVIRPHTAGRGIRAVGGCLHAGQELAAVLSVVENERMPMSTREAALFEDCRGRLEAIAYRLLGSAGDAEDAVQDTFLRWHGADREQIETPEAWLTKVLTNICLNQLTSARVRRESYVGQWLPEPVLAVDRMLGPHETVEQRESLSLALLTVLERLTPNERAVYVLREAFGYSHREVAEILDLTEVNCQQIYRRAKQHVSSERSRNAVGAKTARRVVEEFLAAAVNGETESLVRMLTDTAVGVADGGGTVPARRTPVLGARRVAHYMSDVFRGTAVKRDLVGGVPSLYVIEVNGAPAALVEVDGQVYGVFCFDTTEEGIAAIHIQLNPDKLKHVMRDWPAAAPQRPFVVGW